MIAHQPILQRMRIFLSIMLITLLAGIGARAQGLVTFANLASGVDAPVINAVTREPVAGSGFLAQLYGGHANALEAELVPISMITDFLTGAAAGFFRELEATNDFVLPGMTGTFQVRAWSGTYGSYEAALLAAQADGNVLLGKSLVFQNRTGSPPNGFETLTGLQSFALAPLAPVPEPSPLLLLGLGLLSLYRRRRR